ncbi:PREDICTED: acyl-CoA synthetase short-chain family member 3, mitochondrial [Propithecus coquereli]|uniref:acyl-CoA synthetase short-chain family member 3, mitochondrial n=1 Tax=Propithecus coquereli TaxID=379532 RepID=UPI00063FD014|nr:PREDICTED: acyl-CoA synthetase short-chain family member 3, mitochondrial [Propithecus coquereli]
MKPSWLQCRKVTGAGGLGGPLPGSSPARGAGAARRAFVAPGPWGGLGGRGCRALTSGSVGEYKTHFAASVADPERFWGQAAEQISWYKPWTKTLENRHPPSTSWFVEGVLNICYNAIDRHIENGKGDKIAIIYDSPVTNTKATITYKEVLEQVSKLAGVLVKHGIKKGDTVVIYMPMIPQAMYTMLACARIGAIHSLIFGGFASKELSSRIDHVKVCALFGEIYRPWPVKVFVQETVPLAPDRDLDWDEEMAKAQSHDCVPVLSEHPLYILYTSGTTGLPKGVVRPTGGYAVMLNWTMSSIYGLKPGEVWWAASDLGWVVGHSYICYGPLIHGNTTVLYEVIQLIRFKTLFVAGERCDVETLEWSKKVFRVPVLDHWWQTGFQGYYDTMDAGYMDEEGYLYVMSRVDDVINVAGHRISAGAIEESVLSHGTVADCAVVGKEDPLKGHVPLALCVLKKDINVTEEKVLEEIVKHVRQNIGPVAAFRNAVFVKQLPKTRSGKIPRSALSALVNGKPYKVTSTIEDPSIFGHIEEVLKQAL